MTFAEFAADWLSCQTFDPSTREAVSSRLRVHLLPTLGSLQLRDIRPSTVQAWLRGRQDVCAPRYVRVMLANLSAILGAAVEDDLIQRNPCRSSAVRAPAVQPKTIIPWTVVQLEAGTSIRAVAEYLGHSDPGFTLRVYTHLMPSRDDRARQAVDHAFDPDTTGRPALPAGVE